LSLALRLYRLGFNDLWYDEALTAQIAAGDSSIASDFQPPLYTIIISILLPVFKNSEFLFRFPAMFFGVLSILGIYKLTSILFNKHVGLISAVLLCFSPMHLWYSQEARANTLATFFAIYSIYFFMLLVKKKGRLSLWVFFTLSTVLGLYSSYFIMFLLIPELFILFLEKRRELVPKVIICWGISLLFFLPWVLIAASDKINVVMNGSFWIEHPHFNSLICTWDVFNMGYNGYSYSYLAGRVITFLLICGCFVMGRGKIKSVLPVFSLFFIPTLAVFLISQWRSIYLIRKMMIFLPFYLSMVGYGFFLLNKKSMRLFLILLFIVFGIFSIANYYKNYIPTSITTAVGYMGTYVKKPFKPIVNYINKNIKDGDVVGFSVMNVDIAYYWDENDIYYYFYLPSACDLYTLEIIIKSQESWNNSVINLSKEFISPIPSRIWLISSSWDRGDKLNPDSLEVKNWFEQRYPKIQERNFDGVVVTLFDTSKK